MKKLIVTATLALTSCIAMAGDFTGHVSGVLGQKNLESDDWDRYDTQGEFGVIFDFKMKNWPISIAFDSLISADYEEYTDSNGNNIETTAATSEVHIGVRKIWDINDSSFSPYIGAGIALISGGIDQEINGFDTDSNDSSTGSWIGTGIYWIPMTHISVGFDLRYSQAEVRLFGNGVEAGGLHTGLLVGYHW